MISFRRNPAQIEGLAPAQVIKSRIHERDYTASVLGEMDYSHLQLEMFVSNTGERLRTQVQGFWSDHREPHVAAPDQVVVKNSQASTANGTESVPQPDHIEQFFTYGHLPEPLAEISKVLCDAAQVMLTVCPRNPERTAGLRKLLEAKDCFVRAVVAK